MEYAFDKHKLPRGFSFPLNRSVLDSALTHAQIAHVYCVYYWRRSSGDIVLRADYCAETNRAWAAGKTSITLYAVPSSERNATELLLLHDGLPQLTGWLQAAEQAANVWRCRNHAITFQCRQGQLVVQRS